MRITPTRWRPIGTALTVMAVDEPPRPAFWAAVLFRASLIGKAVEEVVRQQVVAMIDRKRRRLPFGIQPGYTVLVEEIVLDTIERSQIRDAGSEPNVSIIELPAMTRIARDLNVVLPVEISGDVFVSGDLVEARTPLDQMALIVYREMSAQHVNHYEPIAASNCIDVAEVAFVPILRVAPGIGPVHDAQGFLVEASGTWIIRGSIGSRPTYCGLPDSSDINSKFVPIADCRRVEVCMVGVVSLASQIYGDVQLVVVDLHNRSSIG